MKRIAIILFMAAFVTATAHAQQTRSARNTLDAYAPFEDLFQVTPSDVTVYDPPIRGCFVETAGDVSVNMVKGDAAIGSSDAVISFQSGALFPAMIDQVLASTTAELVCGN